ncbi:hypothetical protein [Marivirga harenae]|uniref:hypothetical protein n=1 Tax=Marivirga harenae TaxID=2010992 RepID=UPI0026DF39CA|nr:hypothetical protein [Marivirga harenae]WKV12903.1 hypothetical protein Q3Y49_03555 [Marivirga harenae]|tara:strand:- start:50237 stop:51133 length:897 start_codon:yes stop_codon:yes gene_type:complete
MIRSFFLLVIFFSYSFVNSAQEIIKPKLNQASVDQFSFQVLGKLPETINEASGLETFDSNLYWTHNDGGIPVLFGIDSIGTIIKTVHLANKNRGWEDLTRDDYGNLYIGAFGNNKSDKKELKIYIVPNPDSITAKVTLAKVISFSFEDQKAFPPTPDRNNFDIDAFFCLNDSLYLFTKNRTKPYNGLINVYALPITSGDYIAKKVDAFKLDGAMLNNWITGADISKDKGTIALLFHHRIITIENFLTPVFSKGTFTEYKLNQYSHKAGIVFTKKKQLMIVDEREMNFIGGNIYQFNYQ